MGLLIGAAVAGGVGAGVAVALPVIGIAAVVGVLGFHSTGIAAGSIAASLMSSSAIACGGGVPAAGLVATLQSIGAAGTISGVASAAAGTATSGTTAALIAILV